MENQEEENPYKDVKTVEEFLRLTDPFFAGSEKVENITNNPNLYIKDIRELSPDPIIVTKIASLAVKCLTNQEIKERDDATNKLLKWGVRDVFMGDNQIFVYIGHYVNQHKFVYETFCVGDLPKELQRLPEALHKFSPEQRCLEDRVKTTPYLYGMYKELALEALLSPIEQERLEAAEEIITLSIDTVKDVFVQNEKVYFKVEGKNCYTEKLYVCNLPDSYAGMPIKTIYEFPLRSSSSNT